LQIRLQTAYFLQPEGMFSVLDQKRRLHHALLFRKYCTQDKKPPQKPRCRHQGKVFIQYARLSQLSSVALQKQAPAAEYFQAALDWKHQTRY
jgi:hypothetical protein